jgi:hypothetical protein
VRAQPGEPADVRGPRPALRLDRRPRPAGPRRLPHVRLAAAGDVRPRVPRLRQPGRGHRPLRRPARELAQPLPRHRRAGRAGAQLSAAGTGVDRGPRRAAAGAEVGARARAVRPGLADRRPPAPGRPDAAGVVPAAPARARRVLARPGLVRGARGPGVPARGRAPHGLTRCGAGPPAGTGRTGRDGRRRSSGPTRGRRARAGAGPSRSPCAGRSRDRPGWPRRRR